jgi:hypothetical protein
MKKIKKLSLLFILLSILCLQSCEEAKKQDPTPLPNTGNQVVLTYNAATLAGTWIQIDAMDKLQHEIDTSYLYDRPLGGKDIRYEYPLRYKPIEVKDLWTSQAFAKGIILQKWQPSYTSFGLAPYSLFYKLVYDLKIAVPYDEPPNAKTVYRIKFDGLTKEQLNVMSSVDGVPDSGNFNKFTTIIIERIDGNKIKVMTSEKYGATTKYVN